MLGKSDFGFVESDQFFIEEGSMLVRIHRLNKKTIASVIKFSPLMEEWLALNKNNLETESELIPFLNYYNMIPLKS
jgi:hypothetical protein